LNEQRKEQKKTVLRTILIDKDLNDALVKDAKENNIMENALISSILVKYFVHIGLAPYSYHITGGVLHTLLLDTLI
jgi:hypothetical protein